MIIGRELNSQPYYYNTKAAEVADIDVKQPETEMRSVTGVPDKHNEIGRAHV